MFKVKGSILGPLLFIMFYNDFPDHIQSCEVKMYAEQGSHCNRESNRDTENLKNYCFTSDLIIYTKKGKTEAIWHIKTSQLIWREAKITFSGK